MVGGPVGLAVGLGCGVGRVGGPGQDRGPGRRTPSRAARRRPAHRRRPARLLPGRRSGSRVRARVGQPGPAAARSGRSSSRIHHRLEVGVDPAQVWRTVAAHHSSGPWAAPSAVPTRPAPPSGEAVHQLADGAARARAGRRGGPSAEHRGQGRRPARAVPPARLRAARRGPDGGRGLRLDAACSGDQHASTGQPLTRRFSTAPELVVARRVPGRETSIAVKASTPDRPARAAVRRSHEPTTALAVVRDEAGATTAEYATVTGRGVGFAARPVQVPHQRRRVRRCSS